MRLEQLEYLVAISQSNSLNEASKRLYISQQSLGKAIKNLEDELHATLVVRTHNGCHLTREGHEVLANAKDILRQIKEMKQRYNVCNEVEGDLIVICCPSVHETILSDVIDIFSAQLPHIKVTTIRKDSLLAPDLRKRLESCGDETVVSIVAIPDGFVILQKNIAEVNLKFQPVIDDYWVACMSNRNNLLRKANLSLKDLFREKIIIEYPDYPDYGIDRAILDQYQEHGLAQIDKVVDNEHLMYSAISTNNYIGFASNFFVTYSKHLHSYPDVVFRTFTPPIYAKIGFLVSEDQKQNALAQSFTQCFEQALHDAERNNAGMDTDEKTPTAAEAYNSDFYVLP